MPPTIPKVLDPGNLLPKRLRYRGFKNPNDVMNPIGPDDRDFDVLSSGDLIVPLPDYLGPQRSLARLLVPWIQDGNENEALEFCGTGWLFHTNLLVTCRHVVRNRIAPEPAPLDTDLESQAKQTKVTMPGGISRTVAKLVYEAEDIAVLKLEPVTVKQVPIPVRWDGGASIQLTDVLQFPYGQLAVSKGNRVIPASDNWLFHVADTWPGASGGPMLDAANHVFGIHVECVDVAKVPDRCSALGIPYTTDLTEAIHTAVHDAGGAAQVNLGLSLKPFQGILQIAAIGASLPGP